MSITTRASTEESQEKYDPTVSAVLSEQKTQDQSTTGPRPARRQGDRPAGECARRGRRAGHDEQCSLEADEAAGQPTQTSGQTSMSDNTQFGVNKTEIHTMSRRADCNAITAAILVDDAVVRSVVQWQGDLQEVQAVAGGAGQDPAVCGGGDRL